MSYASLFAHLDPEDRAAALSTLRHDIARRQRAASREGEKRCPACATVLPVSDFGANAARPDGLQSVCRACRRKLV